MTFKVVSNLAEAAVKNLPHRLSGFFFICLFSWTSLYVESFAGPRASHPDTTASYIIAGYEPRILWRRAKPTSDVGSKTACRLVIWRYEFGEPPSKGFPSEVKAAATPEALRKRHDVGRATSVRISAPGSWTLDLLDCTIFGGNRALVNSSYI